MIRVNLLPQKKRVERRSGEGGQLWLVALLLLCLAELGGLVVFHGFKLDELKEQQRGNDQLETQIKTAQESVKDHKQIQAKLQTLQKREDAIAELQKARSGPTAVLLEVARILSPGRGPSVAAEELDRLRKEDPLSMYNPNWDPRRLWLTAFVEAQRQVTIRGYARDGEDVAELAKRMNLSSYFHEVKLLPANQVKLKGLEVVSFQLQAKVRY